jgi:dynein heavy chain
MLERSTIRFWCTFVSHIIQGAYIHGLFLDGAGWCGGEGHDEHEGTNELSGGYLDEPQPRVLQTPMRTIWLKPVSMDSNVNRSEEDQYMCPCYKTSQRWGVLSTTGHSNNFVMMIGLPLGRNHNAKHWVKRGVALLTQLDN